MPAVDTCANDLARALDVGNETCAERLDGNDPERAAYGDEDDSHRGSCAPEIGVRSDVMFDLSSPKYQQHQ